MNGNFVNKSQKAAACLVLGISVLLSACEAELDLSGVDFSKEQPFARYDNYQAAAVSSKAAVIVGNRGVVLVSSDGGTNWVRNRLPGSGPNSYPTLIDIDLCPDNRFIALDVDRKIWISDVDGQNWVAKDIPTEEEVIDLTCNADGAFWVVGSFTLIIVSHDGGEKWIDKSISEDAMFSRVQFVDQDHGVVSGEFGTVFMTQDGGETWDPANMIPDEFYPMASHFVSAEEGWVGGLQGIIFHTQDGGQNWQRQNTDTVAPLYTIFSLDAETYAIGEQGTMLVLSGEEWKSVATGLGFGYLRAAAPVGGGKVLIAGGGGLVETIDPQGLR